MRTIATSLKKCSVNVCGWGPSDCQYCWGEGFRRAATPQPGLDVETVQEARDEISRRFGGTGDGDRSTTVSSFEGLVESRRLVVRRIGVIHTVILHFFIPFKLRFHNLLVNLLAIHVPRIIDIVLKI